MVRGSIVKFHNIAFNINPTNINADKLTPIEDIKVMTGSLFRFNILTKKYPGKTVKKMIFKTCLTIGNILILLTEGHFSFITIICFLNFKTTHHIFPYYRKEAIKSEYKKMWAMNMFFFAKLGCALLANHS